MEQQNQQPTQEKIENKPPMKTNWKFIAIVAVFVLLAVGGILLFAYLSKLHGMNPILYTQCHQLYKEIDTLIKQANYCEVDEDCAVSAEATYPGSCWSLVNKAADVASLQEKKFQWENLDCGKGRVYEQCARAPQILKCRQNQCVGAWNQDNSAIDTSEWQTYRNDEFGFEVRYPEEFVVEYSSTTHTRLRNRPRSFTIDIVVSLDRSIGGLNYCEIHQDLKRCEKFTQQNISGVIDWEFVRANQGEPFRPMALAIIDIGNKMTLSVQLQALEINSETKALFRTFLSTLRFVE